MNRSLQIGPGSVWEHQVMGLTIWQNNVVHYCWVTVWPPSFLGLQSAQTSMRPRALRTLEDQPYICIFISSSWAWLLESAGGGLWPFTFGPSDTRRPSRHHRTPFNVFIIDKWSNWHQCLTSIISNKMKSGHFSSENCYDSTHIKYLE